MPPSPNSRSSPITHYPTKPLLNWSHAAQPTSNPGNCPPPEEKGVSFLACGFLGGLGNLTPSLVHFHHRLHDADSNCEHTLAWVRRRASLGLEQQNFLGDHTSLSHVTNSETSKRRIVGECLEAPGWKIRSSHTHHKRRTYIGLEGMSLTIAASPLKRSAFEISLVREYVRLDEFRIFFQGLPSSAAEN